MLSALAAVWLLPAQASYKVEVEAPKPLREILENHLDLSRYKDRTDLSPDQFDYMVETVGEQVRQFASTEGYFDPVTTTHVEGEGDKRVVHLKVDPGARTLIRNVDIKVDGPAATRSPEQIAEVQKMGPARRRTVPAGELGQGQGRCAGDAAEP